MTNATHDCTGCPVSAGTHKPADAVHQIGEPATELTDQQIDEVFARMPDGAQGFLKSWGYRQFAREIAALATPSPAVPASGFELWWADHTPESTQEQAWAAWVALYRDSAEPAPQAALAAAPAAPAKAVLDGRWKRRMLDGRPLVRDAMGFGDHPEIPMLDEGMKPREFFAALGIYLERTMAEDDLELEEHEAMNDAGNWSAWTPQPPKGEGWLLVAIFDTEDGQAAWWMRDADAIAAQAGKGVQ